MWCVSECETRTQPFQLVRLEAVRGRVAAAAAYFLLVLTLSLQQHHHYTNILS